MAKKFNVFNVLDVCKLIDSEISPDEREKYKLRVLSKKDNQIHIFTKKTLSDIQKNTMSSFTEKSENVSVIIRITLILTNSEKIKRRGTLSDAVTF